MAETRLKQVLRTPWLSRLALGVLVALPILTAISCNLRKEVPYTGLGGGGEAGSSGSGIGPNCVGPNCAAQCEKNPHPGCPCDVEGQHLLCGKVDATYPDGTPVCGQGVSVCTKGKWGECVINNAVTLMPEGPPGYWAKGLGTGSTCINNPCDPGCVSFDDNGNGLSDPDGGITGTDGGVTLSGDGGNLCVPKSCADQGKNCGPVSDTCGGLLQCGTCISPMTCGGAGVPSVCGTTVNCTNLCLQQVTCPSNGTTSISGKVYAPNGVDPLPNATVFVPNAPVDPFVPGVACDNCQQQSGAPLVSTLSAVDGSFTLSNMPVGANIPLVIQIGRWRRQITIPQVTACTNTVVTTTPAAASACGVVIEEVYGGGGGLGATFKNDFVVLHNKGLNTANLSSWSLQYASATGTSWTRLNLAGSIAPGGYYLIRLAGGLIGGNLPTPDISTTGIDMSTTAGKVALVSNQTTLSGSCPTANVVDFVGYGAANCSEGSSPVPTLSATTSASRKTNGCTDTNVSSADFTVSTPALAPRSSFSSSSVCTSCDVRTRFAKNKTEGDIPKIAFVTGKVDGMECVFRKIGIDDSEFTNPSGTGRVNFYWGGADGGTYIDLNTPGEYDLLSSPTELAKFDMVLFPCQGTQYSWSFGDQAIFQSNLADYADAGGRIFATHYNYGWLIDDGGTYASPLSPAVNWNINQSNPNPDPQTGYIDQSFPKGQTLAQWLQIIGASTTQGQISINTLRHDFDSVVPPTQRWMYLDDKSGLVISHVYGGGGLVGATYRNDFVVLHNRGNSAIDTSTYSLQAPPTANPGVRISQVYGGGGLAGATYRQDFVSLHNGGLATIDLSSWSLQYAAATGTTWTRLNLNGSIAPGGYYLIRLSSAGSNGTNISNGNTDQSSTAIDLNATAGKVALVSNQTTLTGACPTANIIDFVGYGAANCSEGTPTAALAVNRSALRGGAGCTDANANSTDFTTPTPTLQNSGTTPVSCVGSWQKVNLTGSVAPGGYHLVALGSSGAVGAALPPADLTNTTMNLATNDGTVVLLSNQTTVTGGCPGGAAVLDRVAYGNGAACAENSPAPALSVSTSALRGSSGCTDDDDNSADLTAVTLAPNNSTSPAVGCSTPMHLTFNTPLGVPATQQCGRVVFSDFHVEDANDTNVPFPSECPGGAMTPQEKLLEYMLFDLASCVAPDTGPACTPVSCAAQGLNCGMAGDGCGNTIDCGTCAAPLTCGGGGLPGVCGLPVTYNDGYFIRDYDATGLCPNGTGPVWRLYSWSAFTPGNSYIEFFVQTAPNLTALNAAPSDPQVFSNPPGPSALVGQPTVAHAVNVPSMGAPDTQIGAASPDYTLLTNGRIRGHDFVRVTAHLVPTSNGAQAPTLTSWNMQIDCLPNQ